MADRLKEIFEIQREFDKKQSPKVYDGTMDLHEKEELTHYMALAAIRELSELIECTNFRRHRLKKNPVNVDNLREEFIDVMKFLLNLAAIWDIDADVFYNEFKRKSEVVSQKWSQEQLLHTIKEDDKVIAIDIDGVLGEYDKYFLSWCRKHEDVHAVSIGHLIESYGRDVYNKCKDGYRKSGAKSKMPVKAGAKELTKFLHSKGYKVVVLSARPYKQYTRIWADTLEWLKKNDIEFDAIIFDRDKEDVLVERFDGRVKLFIDDDLGNIRKVSGAGYNCIWINNSGGAECLPANVWSTSTLEVVPTWIEQGIIDIG